MLRGKVTSVVKEKVFAWTWWWRRYATLNSFRMLVTIYHMTWC